MEIGALTVMTVGFREREVVLHLLELITGLRMNHAFVRPGGLAQDIPPGALDAVREMIPAAARGIGDIEKLSNENPVVKARLVGRRLPRPRRLHGAGDDRPGAALHGPAARPAQSAALLRLRDLRLRRPDRDTCDAYGRLRIRIDEMYESLRIVAQCARPAAGRWSPAAVMIADSKIAWPAQLAIGSDGMGNSLDHIREIMGTSMEALIHHFKLVTEGFRVPPGQVYQAVESARGELGVAPGLRRRDAAVPGALPGPVVRQPAGRGRDVRGRSGRRRHRRGRVDSTR